MASVTFLGTAGARFVVGMQLRASGGFWISAGGTNLLTDPGPGSLVRCLAHRPPLKPPTLDGIFLSHKHIDHSGDVNAMIEAMTNGGFIPRGTVLAPADALDGDPVILRYLRAFPEKISVLREGCAYRVGNVSLDVPVRHIHGVETYGFLLRAERTPCVGYAPDTRYFDGLAEAYRPARILILNVVFHETRTEFDHMSLPEAERLIGELRPDTTVLTHFGMTMLKNRIWEQTDAVSQRVGAAVLAAEDGMTIDIPETAS